MVIPDGCKIEECVLEIIAWDSEGKDRKRVNIADTIVPDVGMSKEEMSSALAFLRSRISTKNTREDAVTNAVDPTATEIAAGEVDGTSGLAGATATIRELTAGQVQAGIGKQAETAAGDNGNEPAAAATTVGTLKPSFLNSISSRFNFLKNSKAGQMAASATSAASAAAAVASKAAHSAAQGAAAAAAAANKAADHAAQVVHNLAAEERFLGSRIVRGLELKAFIEASMFDFSDEEEDAALDEDDGPKTIIKWFELGRSWDIDLSKQAVVKGKVKLESELVNGDDDDDFMLDLIDDESKSLMSDSIDATLTGAIFCLFCGYIMPILFSIYVMFIL